MSSNDNENSTYSAKNIEFLSQREHIRKRPGMYVGGTDTRAFHHLLWEVVDDALVEVMSEHNPCDTITITLFSPTQVRVSDNGLGISVDALPNGTSTMQAHMTELWQSNIRASVLNKPIQVSGGLHGIGAITVNALSSNLVIESKRDGFLWRQTYSEGLPTSKVHPIRPLEQGEATGTSITFIPDFTIMEKGLRFDFRQIMERCEELAYLLPQANFILIQDESIIVYDKPNGISDWVQAINAHQQTLHDVLYTTGETTYLTQSSIEFSIKVEIALQFVKSDEIVIQSYVNTVHTSDGGTHEDNLLDALKTAIYDDNDEDTSLKGLTAIIHIFHADPHFENQTEIRLLNDDVKDVIHDAIDQLVQDNADVFNEIKNLFRR
ncbi:MAG: ATP-binding protein [Chloroflexota bacterium]